jgi:hypothetical protein
MGALLVPGQKTWSMVRDMNGHRTYKLKMQVQCTALDGPAIAINCAGLPTPGSVWQVDNDLDVWAWCRWDASVTPMATNEPNTQFECEFTFSTMQEYRNCHTVHVTDPLLEPQKVSGSFVTYQEEATYDMNGMPIVNSSHELIRGPQVEFDKNRANVIIEQNVASLGLAFWAPMIDTVNTAPLWGLPKRCIKLSKPTWERKFHDLCSVYYTRRFEFDIRFDTFDRNVLDEGTKVLHGQWNPVTGHWNLININGLPPDPTNPSHFDRFKDRQGENARVILNGAGEPANVLVGTGTVPSGPPGNIFVQKYTESDFLTLGIPVTF